jgi:hypothetical protein
MAMTRAARPTKKPGEGRAVPRKGAVKNKVAAKKASAKKKVSKKNKTAAKKSAGRVRRELAAKREAAIESRRRTVAATRVDVGPEPVAVEPSDEAAQAGIGKRQWAGRRTAVDRTADPPQAIGIALVERVTRAVERELSQIEVIVGGHHVKPQQRTEAERRARTLASLARTLTEVRKLRADEHRVNPQDDPDRPRDLEELRRRLSERLGRMRRGRTAPAAGGNETGGGGLSQ